MSIWSTDPFAVVGATVIFEAAVAAMLITRWHERVALGLATLWVLGLIPALAWPYWLVNVARDTVRSTVVAIGAPQMIKPR